MSTEKIEMQRDRMRIYAMKLFGLQLSPAASMFGEIAQVLGCIDQNQLQAALALQESFRGNGSKPPRIGEILLDEGLLNEEQLGSILEEQTRISSTMDESEETRFANLRRRAERLQREKVDQ